MINKRDINNLARKKARKVTTKQGTPDGREGRDGDITIRSTSIGMYLYAKVNGIWYGTPLVKVPGSVKRTLQGQKISEGGGQDHKIARKKGVGALAHNKAGGKVFDEFKTRKSNKSASRASSVDKNVKRSIDGNVAVPGALTVTGNTTLTGSDFTFRYGGLTIYQDLLTCNFSGNDDKDTTHAKPAFKLPAYGVIKSVGCVVQTLSDLGTYNLALYVSTDAESADGDVLNNSVEILGAGETTTMSGGSASATHIDAGTSAGRVKTAWYSTPDMAFGTADKYVYAGMGAAGQGDTNPGTAAVLRIFVEFVGVD